MVENQQPPPGPLNLAQLNRLLSHDLDSRLEAELLIGEAIQQTRTWLYSHPEYQPTPEQLQRLDRLTGHRRAGQPIAYLLGRREFYGRDFRVDSNVLIPRPETELLIEQALETPLPTAARILDIGTGSGCIILTLAAERPGWRCSAIDISAAALDVARQNQIALGLAQRPIEWLQGDLFKPLEQAKSNPVFDLIVSNPPYVARNDPHLEQGDLRFEPDVALTSGDDGFDTIRRLIETAPNFLKRDGRLLIEHGYDQSKVVRKLFKKRGFADVSAVRDLAGIRRVATGTWPAAADI